MKVIFNEPLHHVCLMYGLKAAFEKMPSMNRRILNIGGKTVTIDNIVIHSSYDEKSTEGICVREQKEQKYRRGVLLEG